MNNPTDRMIEALKKFYYSNNAPGLAKFIQGEMKVLSFIHQNHSSITPGEIAASLDMTAARVASVLRTLEKKGYILRETSDSDRRKVLVRATDKGADCVDEGLRLLQNQLNEIISCLGEYKTETIIRSLNDLSDAVEKTGKGE